MRAETVDTITMSAYELMRMHSEAALDYYPSTVGLRGPLAQAADLLDESFQLKTEELSMISTSFLTQNATKTELTRVLQRYVDDVQPIVAIDNQVFLASNWDIYLAKLMRLHLNVYNVRACL